MEPGFNPALEAQAIGRVHRLGQKRSVEICRLVIKDSFETRMISFLSKKYGLTFDEANSKDRENVANSDNSDVGSHETKEDGSSGMTENQTKPSDQLVGNLATERAQVMAEEFDELFGVQERVAADISRESGTNASTNNGEDDDGIAPDATLSGFI